MLGALRASPGLPALVRVVAGLLRVLALDVDGHSQGILIFFYLLVAAVSIIVYTYTYHVSAYWFIFTRGRSDVLFCIVLLSLAIGSSMATIKLLFMYFNSKKLKELVSAYLRCDAAVVPDSRMSRNVLATLALVRRRAAVFWLVIIGNGVVYILQPLFIPGRHLLDDKQILLGLEPMFESPNYEIALVVVSISVFFTVYTAASITAFVIIIVGYTEAQLQALSQELLHVWADALHHYQKTTVNSEDMSVDDYSTQDEHSDQDTITNNRVIARSSRTHIENITEKNTIINNYVKHRLVSIMKMHAMNIDLIKQVEGIFQNAIAAEFALLSAALIAELLGGSENAYLEMPFALVQVVMDCITGQKLVDANKAFEQAVYDCKWENFDVSNMKLVMVMLQNAQKTMKLSAGGVASLNYESLMTVVRAIYSAYAALRSTV